MKHNPGCRQPDVVYHNQLWVGLKIVGYCQACGATETRRPWGDLALNLRFRTSTPEGTKLTDLESILDRHGLPAEAARFLPPGPDIEGRARDLAELLRQIRTNHLVTTIGRNN